LLDHPPEARPHAIKFVDEGQAGHAVLLGLAPYRLGLGLHPGHPAEHAHRAVQHAQGSLHLHREIHVAGRVNDVDLVLAPVAGGGRAGDGDAALLLLDHPVHGGRTLVHLADAMHLAGVEKDTLRGRGLARVNVGNNADIADVG
jgi:hypothetical protein